MKKPGAALLLALATAGCGHVPVSTMARLATFDPLLFDPAALRVASQSPDWLAPRPGGAHLKFTFRRGEETQVERFTLQEANDQAAALSAFARPGARIDGYRLAPADIARVRDLQAQATARRAAGGGKTTVSLAVDVDACRRGDIPEGPILGSTHIRVDAAQGWMTLLSNLDLRKLAADAGEPLAARLPPCAA